MSAAAANVAEPIGAIEPSEDFLPRTPPRKRSTVVRDGVITGEGPTTKGRVHFSRALDADDAAWCARILTATAVEHQPVSRAEAEALFEINDAAAERSDDGRFDDLLAKAVVHHAASASGLPVPPRTVALSPDTAIESWAPTQAVGVDTEVLEWIASQMRGKRRSNRTLMTAGRHHRRRGDAAAGAPAERVRHRDVSSLANPRARTAGLLPRRFLFAVLGVEADRPSRKSRRIEIALRQHALDTSRRSAVRWPRAWR